MLWVIDAGNTHTRVGRWDDGEWHDVQTIRTGDHLEVNIAGFGPVAIASVVPKARVELVRLAAELGDPDPYWLSVNTQRCVEVDYSTPHSLGGDRLANAIALSSLVGPSSGCIDLGTATKMDVLDSQGHYIGGAILPGMATAFRALVQSTAQLFEVPLSPPEHAIGRSSEECLRSGAFWSHVEAINGLANRMNAEIGKEVKWGVTGGLGSALAPHLLGGLDFHPTWTMDGIRLACESWR